MSIFDATAHVLRRGRRVIVFRIYLITGMCVFVIGVLEWMVLREEWCMVIGACQMAIIWCRLFRVWVVRFTA